jgi:hypothetical protein
MRTPQKEVYGWFGVFALTTVAYQLVQDRLRPGYTGEEAWVVYLLGVAPNFFPAIGLPALFVILLPEVMRQQPPDAWWVRHRHIVANSIAQVGLLGWEFMQLATTRGHFDWHDVLWTLIGAAVFQALWAGTHRHRS